jgi:TIR domain
MAGKVFISYRRDDSSGHAGRVHDRLQREFGHDLLFMDVDAIPLGANFVKVLGEEVAKCDALLAIIGPGWLNARDDTGKRRLENPTDFVRIEIGTALKRSIPVIPILLEGTRIPKADQLPDDLKELALRNGLDVRHASFPQDMERLVRALKGAQSPRDAPSRKVWTFLATTRTEPSWVGSAAASRLWSALCGVRSSIWRLHRNRRSRRRALRPGLAVSLSAAM